MHFVLATWRLRSIQTRLDGSGSRIDQIASNTAHCLPCHRPQSLAWQAILGGITGWDVVSMSFCSCFLALNLWRSAMHAQDRKAPCFLFFGNSGHHTRLLEIRRAGALFTRTIRDLFPCNTSIFKSSECSCVKDYKRTLQSLFNTKF